MNADTLLLESSFVPDAKGISTTRRIVDDLSSHVLDDPDLGWRLAMAAHELLDNARKYGREGTVRFRLKIDATKEGYIAMLRVENRDHAENRANLLSVVREIQSAADPWALYLTALQRTASRDDGSGLGLARISAEGEMTLTVSVGDDENIRVEATLERGRTP